MRANQKICVERGVWVGLTTQHGAARGLALLGVTATQARERNPTYHADLDRWVAGRSGR